LERGNAVGVESGSIDVGILGEGGQFRGTGIESETTAINIAQADLTRRSGTSLDGIKEIFMMGELRNDALAGGGNSENRNGMRQEQRTNSKVNFTAVGIDSNPEVVATRDQLAVVDNDGIGSVESAIDGAISERRDSSIRVVSVARTVAMIAIVVEVKQILSARVSQKSVKRVVSTRSCSVGEDLELEVAVNVKASRNIDMVDLDISVVGRGEINEVGRLVESQGDIAESDQASIEIPDSIGWGTDGVKVDTLNGRASISIAVGISDGVKVLIKNSRTTRDCRQLNIEQSKFKILASEIKAVEFEHFGGRTISVTSGENEAGNVLNGVINTVVLDLVGEIRSEARGVTIESLNNDFLKRTQIRRQGVKFTVDSAVTPAVVCERATGEGPGEVSVEIGGKRVRVTIVKLSPLNGHREIGVLGVFGESAERFNIIDVILRIPNVTNSVTLEGVTIESVVSNQVVIPEVIVDGFARGFA